jgi:hypothetical protein
MVTQPDERPVRGCDVCGLEDADPRHVVGMDDGTDQTRHLQCCAQVGCPDGSCDTLMAEAGDISGDELIDFLTSQPPPEE